MTTDNAHLNQALALARVDAETQLPQLEAAYARLLRAAGRAAARSFTQLTAVTVTAAVNPWQPPVGDLVDGEALEQDALAAVTPIHRRALKAAAPAGDLGVAFDVGHATSQSLLASVAARLSTLGDAIREQVNETIEAGYAQGWSVAKTAGAITAKVDAVTPGRAAALARTDLNAISNGASVAMARAVGADTKTWLATEDERTRETHSEADGQTVPIDQPFTVGGEQADYPGDPQLSDEESFNCRCSVIYGDPLTAAATAEGGEMTHDQDTPTTDASQTQTLVALREAFPNFESISDAHLLAMQSLILAARSKHRYAGDGDACAICGEGADDKTAHHQALAAGLTEFTIVAAAAPGEATRWVAPAIAVENQPTEDGRILMPGSVTWRDGILPLGLMLETPHGDMGSAPLCGGIDSLERIGGVISAAGFFNDASDDETLAATARTAIAALESRSVGGISVDLMVLKSDMIVWPVQEEMDPASEDELPPEVDEDLGLPPMDGPMLDPAGDAEQDAEEDADEPEGRRILAAVYEGVIGGACIVPVPAIANASIVLAASAGFFDRVKLVSRLFADCGCDETPVAVSLVAAIAPLAPPKEWFDEPRLDRPTPLTVTDDGRVYGHAALWNTCHEGFPGRCVPTPRSRSGYRKFHNGEMRVADGGRINVGKITLAAGHARTFGITEEQVRAHYDNTATVAAFVRAGEDSHGIWVAGALKSDLAPELVRDLMANPLSGDWRDGEMVAAHAVVDPGFPVLRASGFGCLFDEEEPSKPVGALSYLRPGRRKQAAA